MQPSAFHQDHALVEQAENNLANKIEGMEQQFLALAEINNENQNNNNDSVLTSFLQQQMQFQEKMSNAF